MYKKNWFRIQTYNFIYKYYIIQPTVYYNKFLIIYIWTKMFR